MTQRVLLLPGDGIGPEVVAQAEDVGGGVGGSVEMRAVMSSSPGSEGKTRELEAADRDDDGKPGSRLRIRRGAGRNSADRNDRLTRLTSPGSRGAGGGAGGAGGGGTAAVETEHQNPMHKKQNSMELTAPKLKSTWHTVGADNEGGGQTAGAGTANVLDSVVHTRLGSVGV